MFSCDVGSATTQEGCESTGECFDFLYGTSVEEMWNYNDTVCIVPLEKWGEGCFAIIDERRPTSFGCMLYAIDGFAPNAASCAAEGGTMVPQPNTEALCSATPARCYRLAPGAVAVRFFDPIVYTAQSEADCALVEGSQWQSPLQWRSGQWKSGQPRTTRWLTDELVQAYEWGPSFNLMEVRDKYLAAIESFLKIAEKSYAFCEYSLSTSTIETLSCACRGANDESCFGSVDDATVAIAEVCGGAAATISSSPLQLQVCPDCLAPPGACGTMTVSRVSALSTETSSITHASPSQFLSFTSNGPYQFQNELGGLVGQFIGDSFSVSVEESLSLTQPILWCLQISGDVVYYDPELYTEYDFAEVEFGIDRIVVTPIRAEIDYSQEQNIVCGTFPTRKGVSYAPVMRASDFEDVWSYRVSTYVFCMVLLFLYVVCLSIALYKFCRVLYEVGHVTFSTGLAFPLIALDIVRIVYFSLVAAFILEDLSPIVVFILVELPLLLYLSVCLYFIVNWAFITRAIKQLKMNIQSQQRQILFAFGGVNLVLYGIFILFCILFSVVIPSSTSTCAGRIVSLDLDSARALSTTYRLVIGVSALVVCLAFAVYGSILWRRLSKNMSTRTSAAARRVTVVTAICVTSLGIEAIFMISIAFVPDYDNNTLSLIMLLLVELGAQAAILFMAEFDSAAGGSSQTSRKSGNTSNKFKTKSSTTSMKADTATPGFLPESRELSAYSFGESAPSASVTSSLRESVVSSSGSSGEDATGSASYTTNGSTNGSDSQSGSYTTGSDSGSGSVDGSASVSGSTSGV
eukprot:TRINITY_DN1600_c0_g1_i2.p1 TRINITY_DN1600_c0_g1~~TRINITY_DN1600_c0_g1_i2.p1  ORF type:complete len:802 (-),score=98.98 TRINITY_DN1600_c0_g1_i2:47-2452(-)